MVQYGYARVSSASQEENSSLASQTKELIEKGILETNIIQEVASATSKIEERPKLNHLIENQLKSGDLLMVTKIDRCSRNTLSFLQLQEKLYHRNITFVSLDLPYSQDLATNQLIATTLVAIATFESQRRKDRQREGIEAAKRAGKYKGRKTVIDQKLIAKVKYFKEVKGLSVTEIAKLTGKGKNTIYKVLKNHLGYVSNRLVKDQKEIN
jgi:DNA invertase Pin-like site-specific DNA recombinase